jgi:hypothetical protein
MKGRFGGMTGMGPAPIKLNLGQRIASVLQHVPGGALLFAVVPLLVLGYLGWYFYGAEHLDQAFYSMKEEHLTVTPQPAWVKANVAEEVFRSRRLDRISLLDPKANATIAQAFETHAWVKSTSRVTKSAGGNVAIDLVYRQPVAMIYCAPPQEGFLPVDADAILLPVDDFSPEEVYNYFLIIAGGDPPAATECGMVYGSSLVAETLKLCQFLEDSRVALGLQNVLVHEEERVTGRGRLRITLETKDGYVVHWGHIPHAELPGESQPEEKLALMTRWLTQQREAGAAPSKLDLLRNASAAPVSARHP